jgi:hypothetical protein
MVLFATIFVVLSHTITIAFASTNNARASIQATSPFDHTWIEKWAAIGDSYASGIGAGHYITVTDNVRPALLFFTELFFANRCILGGTKSRGVFQRILLSILLWVGSFFPLAFLCFQTGV